MNQPVVIIGIGELAGVFARGFLRNGYPVFPITRDMNIAVALQTVPDPALVLVAVAEKDFTDALSNLPSKWRECIGLVQNELLPAVWQACNIVNPTVISVWFEKKKGRDYKVLLPSPVYGPGADLIADSLEQIDIPCKRLSGPEALLIELVIKNIFVFTINIAGLATGGATGALWSEHNELARAVAEEVIDLQEWMTGQTFKRDQLINGLVKGINGDPHHKCTGRSAPARLKRVIEIADTANLKIPKIREIYTQLDGK